MNNTKEAAPAVAAAEGGKGRPEQGAFPISYCNTDAATRQADLLLLREALKGHIPDFVQKKKWYGDLHVGDKLPNSNYLITPTDDVQATELLFAWGFTGQELDHLAEIGLTNLAIFWLINSVLQVDENTPDEYLRTEFKRRLPDMFIDKQEMFDGFCEIIRNQKTDQWFRDRQAAGDELLRLGFTQAELDHIYWQHGYGPVHVYKAVMELLIHGVPDSEAKREFFDVFPELVMNGDANDR